MDEQVDRGRRGADEQLNETTAARVAALLPSVERSMKTSALSVAIFSAILFAHAAVGLSVWLGLRLLATFGILVALGRLRRRPQNPMQSERFLAITMGVSGVVWGLLALLVYPDSPEWRSVVVLWIFGNQSVVTAVCAPSTMAFRAGMGSVCLVAAFSMIVHGGGFNAILALLILLGGAYSFSIFDAMHRVTVTAIEGQLATTRLAASLSDANDTLQRLANQDGLTELPNRRALMAHLEDDAHRLRQAGWLGMVDIDRFKAINDEHGHAAGDAVLALAAKRWRERLPKDVFLARTGGDEFVLSFEGRTPDEVTALGELMIDALGAPIALEAGRPVDASCSVGFTAVHAGEAVSAAMRRADQALYRAKEGGRRVVRFASASDPTVTADLG